MQEGHWYQLNEPDQVDSPALLVYPARILMNIREMIRIAGDPERLVPHVKTHKMSAVIKLQLQAGIHRFKCATIAEAEMVAEAGASEILLAYQLNKTKAERFLKLIAAFPSVRFASLVDNLESAGMLDGLYEKADRRGTIFIDVDNGMHRTGFPAGDDLVDFYRKVSMFPHLAVGGFHVYDGHIHEKQFAERKALCLQAFEPVEKAITTLKSSGSGPIEVIAGGSPTFPIHAQNPAVSLSPGTSLLWDWGYQALLPEQPFIQAAVLLTRVISKNTPGQLTTDLGHKSVAAENSITHRVSFLNLDHYEVYAQSEEHLVIKVQETDRQRLQIGDVLYGVPYHICPSVALYEAAQAVEDGKVTAQWPVEARNRQNHF